MVRRFARCVLAEPDALLHPSNRRKRLEGRAAEGSPALSTMLFCGASLWGRSGATQEYNPTRKTSMCLLKKRQVLNPQPESLKPKPRTPKLPKPGGELRDAFGLGRDHYPACAVSFEGRGARCILQRLRYIIGY